MRSQNVHLLYVIAYKLIVRCMMQVLVYVNEFEYAVPLLLLGMVSSVQVGLQYGLLHAYQLT